MFSRVQYYSSGGINYARKEDWLSGQMVKQMERVEMIVGSNLTNNNGVIPNYTFGPVNLTYHGSGQISSTGITVEIMPVGGKLSIVISNINL